MEALLVSTGVVALGEMGDKTQWLALLLAARFRKPWPIVGGILVATLANHALAGAVGAWVAQALGATLLRWSVGLSFIAMAVWMLIPDKADDAEGAPARWGVFGTTAVAFFIAEMGDKTQIATVVLAARYAELLPVVAGSTLGLMLANVPAVFLGDRVARLVPMRLVHGVSAGIFMLLGVLVLWGADHAQVRLGAADNPGTMNSILATGAAGMRSTLAQLDASAARVAGAASTSPDTVPVNLASEAVTQMVARHHFEAQAQVVKAADAILGTLLDAFA